MTGVGYAARKPLGSYSANSRISGFSRFAYEKSGSVSVTSVVLPAWRGPKTVTTGYFSSASSKRADISRGIIIIVYIYRFTKIKFNLKNVKLKIQTEAERANRGEVQRAEPRARHLLQRSILDQPGRPAGASCRGVLPGRPAGASCRRGLTDAYFCLGSGSTGFRSGTAKIDRQAGTCRETVRSG